MNILLQEWRQLVAWIKWDELMALESVARPYLIAGLTLVGSFVLFEVFVKIVLARLRVFSRKTNTTWDDVLVSMLETIRAPFVFLLASSFALHSVAPSDRWHQVATALLVFALTTQTVKAFDILIRNWLARMDGDEGSKGAFSFVGSIGKFVLWMIGILVILENFGVNITSIVAGLGIGGVAIALAAQNVLGDFFGALSIYFDKPFVVGDFVAVGTRKGTVTRIGIKTTRIRSQEGEELVITNKEITSIQIQNYGKMTERRIEFTLGVAYETTNDQLRRIPGIVRGIIEAQMLTRVDRIHWRKFTDSSLQFEVVYFIDSSEMMVFADIQQEINLRIKESFESEGIRFAYPTETVHLYRES